MIHPEADVSMQRLCTSLSSRSISKKSRLPDMEKLENIINFRASCMNLVIPILINRFAWSAGAETIWQVGRSLGRILNVNASDLDPGFFFRSLHATPFIVRSFHESLDSMASAKNLSVDGLNWMKKVIGDDAKITVLEGELHETRLSPVLHHLKWKYFFEKFRDLDIYAVTQAPKDLRPYFKLLPFFRRASNSFRMLPPHIWVSGGLKSSKSAVHRDSHHNQHCVLKGSKKFMLIPPHIPLSTPEYGWVSVENTDGSKQPGFEGAYGEYAGKLNVSNVDLDAFPLWREVPWYLAELNEGDCLYMPIHWYHYVESDPRPTVSWHVWFHLTEEWIDEPENKDISTIELSPDKCFFKEDKQAKRGLEYDWGNFTNRTSLCIW